MSTFGFGCYLPKSFYKMYGYFLVSTLSPLIFTLILFLVTKFQLYGANPEKQRRLTSSRINLFFTFTYLIFPSLTIIVDPNKFWHCQAYSDDKTKWVVADKSIDCGDPSHKIFMAIELAILLLYPVGITAFYTYELWKHRYTIQDTENREDNPYIQHINFLWRDYRPEFWWFEIYEYIRRLSLIILPGLCEAGGIVQLSLTMVLVVFSLQLYSECKPFPEVEENVLSRISQWSALITLLVSSVYKYDGGIRADFMLDIILILINFLVFGLVAVGFLYKPMNELIRKCNQKHLHDAPLKGIHEEVAYSVDLFVDYFKKLARSNMQEAGWTPLTPKDWSRKNLNEWLAETGALAEWRCADGDGPIDQARVKFVVDSDMETVMSEIISIKERHATGVGSFPYVLDKGGDWRQIYRAIKFPLPLRQRDLIYTEHTRREQGGEVLICSRSSRELSESTTELSLNAGRIRVGMKLGGYLLKEIEGSKTEIVYLLDVDLGGSFAIGFLQRHMAQICLKGVVDLQRKHAETSKREEGNFSASSSASSSFEGAGNRGEEGRREGKKIKHEPYVRWNQQHGQQR